MNNTFLVSVNQLKCVQETFSFEIILKVIRKTFACWFDLCILPVYQFYKSIQFYTIDALVLIKEFPVCIFVFSSLHSLRTWRSFILNTSSKTFAILTISIKFTGYKSAHCILSGLWRKLFFCRDSLSFEFEGSVLMWSHRT